MTDGSHDPQPTPGEAGPSPASPSPPDAPQPRLPWRLRHPTFLARTRWLVVHGLILAGSMAFLSLVVVAFAGWYTSRPEFCRSCHIMEPYYVSWEKSGHKDVSCVECHFPPGFGGKVRGKMLGLVQLAKYVTASAGPRPSAEIPDASCLRSGCHETRLLSGRVDFHGVPFDHGPHLKQPRRGKELRCTSCHSQIVQGTHMTVTTSTCFLCHFKAEEGKKQAFNQGLGGCTNCHNIPKEPLHLGGGVTFTHDLASSKGVGCVNCHGDIIRGTGDVPKERCLSCHNREGDLEHRADHVFMHDKHVTEHKVDCLLCHTPIEHSLDRKMLEHSVGDCKSCHPDHHREQLNMLSGHGGKTVPGAATSMLAIRITCQTCHKEEKTSAKGSAAIWGSTQMCLLCHDAAKVKDFERDHGRLQKGLPKIRETVERLRTAAAAAELPPGRADQIAASLGEILHDVQFLQAANDFHNMHYAIQLHGALVQRVGKLCRELKVPEPEVPGPRPAPPPAPPAK